MTLPNRNNPYSFDAFLEKRETFDFYRDDHFLRKVIKKYAGDEWESLHEQLLAFSPKVSFRWRKLTERIARPDVHPAMLHYDAHNHRIDRIVRPYDIHVLEKEIFSEGLFSNRVTAWESFIMLGRRPPLLKWGMNAVSPLVQKILSTKTKHLFSLLINGMIEAIK